VLKIHLLISVLFLFALPAESSKFKRVRAVAEASATAKLAPEATPIETEQAEYVAGNGERFAVEILTFQTEGKAYELFSRAAAAARAVDPNVETNNVGIAGFRSGDQIAFFKGVNFVSVKSLKPGSSETTALAQSLSDTLDKGDGDIPALIKHLPNPDEAQKNAVYYNSIDDVTSLLPPHPVLTAVKGDGNADAALVSLDSGIVLIVEFNTPQLASENDRRITARIQELWNSGQPAPSAYRRVGNYSVFVFNAPDEQTAKQLIDQVHYEQVVSWLGENPNILRRAEERYIDTTLGLLVTVLKASGYALVGCLGLGGLVGALLFGYRRSQQKAFNAYSDAGGMMRLNLDELSADKSK
jgi:hypothetical protein